MFIVLSGKYSNYVVAPASGTEHKMKEKIECIWRWNEICMHKNIWEKIKCNTIEKFLLFIYLCIYMEFIST